MTDYFSWRDEEIEIMNARNEIAELKLQLRWAKGDLYRCQEENRTLKQQHHNAIQEAIQILAVVTHARPGEERTITDDLLRRSLDIRGIETWRDPKHRRTVLRFL